MDVTLKTGLWQQFGAAIDMLANAIRSCPDKLWRSSLWDHPDDPPEAAQFWYLGYHTLFWLDLYLSGSKEGFSPPAPYTMDEIDPAGLYPTKPYSRDELLTYLEHGRSKCQATIEALTDEKAYQMCAFSWGEVPFIELLLYNLRHVQEHAAQLSLFLGQNAEYESKWVAKAKGQPG